MMDRKRFVVGAAAAAATGAALAADGCSGTLTGTNPSRGVPPVPVSPYELVVEYADVAFGPYTLHLRTYNGKSVGPTLYTAPGQQLSVRVVNKLPPNPKANPQGGPFEIPDDPEMARMFSRHPRHTRLSHAAIDPMNNPHLFNTTNLHVHGVQTIPHIFYPLGTSDIAAPMVAIDPGKHYSYPFPIPADHPSGLFFYHPHHHGSTDVQLSSGMAGLIVVNGPIDAVPEIAAAREIFVAIQGLCVNPVKGKPDHFELEPIAYKPPQDGGYSLGTDYCMLTVNGAGVNWMDLTKKIYTPLGLPEFAMQPGEVVRVRLLNGTNQFIFPLTIEGMEIYTIATDGVNYLAPQAVKQKGTTVVTPSNLYDGSTMLTSPATRIEFLLRAPARPGSYTLRATATKGVSFQDWPGFELARFVVAGSPVQMSIPSSLPQPSREYPLISASEVVEKRTVAFSEGLTSEILTGFGFYINGELYDEMTVSARPKVGTAEEWTLTNSSDEAHPFHLHDNSFQVIAINAKPVDPVLICDTILVPPATSAGHGTVTFRVRFKEYTGKTVYHCHITPHEDTGMMQNILMT